MDVGLLVRMLREAERLSQQTLAKRLGVSRTYLSQIERGARDPGFALLKKLSKELRIPLPLLVLQDTESENQEVIAELRAILGTLLAARVSRKLDKR
ncbi:MAG TPA: helix-turn-helix transcriptional regulator [bacterium]|nr:helix-turn-helix transcriptional regulator [bacterium]